MYKSNVVEGNVSRAAHPVLRDEIFPVFRDCPAVDAIRHDRTVIMHGNKLCERFRRKHHHGMIRYRLKSLGTLLIQMKALDQSIAELEDIFNPIHFNNVVKAINILGKLDTERGIYGSPFTASSLCTALKKCARNLMTQCNIEGDVSKNERIKIFYEVMEDEFPGRIGATVSETSLQRRRHKRIRLPSTSDIKTLANYVADQRQNYFNTLGTDGFNFDVWKKLASYTLISIQVFNRRRPGEMERTLIDDFRSYTDLHKNSDNLHDFPTTKQSWKRYVRFVIRGKLGRTVPVLLDREVVSCVELVLNYRDLAGVPPNNPYVFGLPGRTEYNHLQAVPLMREYAMLCGAKSSQLLRGTLLRKHVATQSAMYNMEDNQVNDLAMFLGHERKIHQDHYRQPVATRDIVDISQVLERAQG